jgi:hypothetical protein
MADRVAHLLVALSPLVVTLNPHLLVVVVFVQIPLSAGILLFVIQRFRILPRIAFETQPVSSVFDGARAARPPNQ